MSSSSASPKKAEGPRRNPSEELAFLEKNEAPVADKKVFEKTLNELKAKQASSDIEIRKLSIEIDKMTLIRSQKRKTQGEAGKVRSKIQEEMNVAKTARDAKKKQLDQMTGQSKDIRARQKQAKGRLGKGIRRQDKESFSEAISREILELENKIEMGECQTLKAEKDILKEINSLKKRRKEAGVYEKKNVAQQILADENKFTVDELKDDIKKRKLEMDKIFLRLDESRKAFNEVKVEHDESNNEIQESINKRKQLGDGARGLRREQGDQVKNFRNRQQNRRRWEQKIDRARVAAQRFERRQAGKQKFEAEEAAYGAARTAVQEKVSTEQAEANALKKDIADRKAARDEKNRIKMEEEQVAYKAELAKWKESQKAKDPYEAVKNTINRLIKYCQNFIQQEAAVASGGNTFKRYVPKDQQAFDGAQYQAFDGIFAMGGGGKKKKGKKKKKKKAKQLKHDVSLFKEFEQVKITLPMTQDDVSKTLDALKSKMQYYLDKPAEDERKAEAKAAKAEQRKQDAAAKKAAAESPRKEAAAESPQKEAAAAESPATEPTTNADAEADAEPAEADAEQKEDAASEPTTAASGEATMMDLSKLPPNKRKEAIIAEKRRLRQLEEDKNAEAVLAKEAAEDAEVAAGLGNMFGDDSDSDES